MRIVVRPAHEVVHGVEVVRRIVERKRERAALCGDGQRPHRESARFALVGDRIAHGEFSVRGKLDVQRVIEVLSRTADESASVCTFAHFHGEVVRGVRFQILRRLPHAVSAVEVPRRAFAVRLVEILAAFGHVAVDVLVHEIELRRTEPYYPRSHVQRDHHFDSAAFEHGAFAVIFVIFRFHISSLYDDLYAAPRG